MLGRPYDLDGKRVFVAGHRGMVGAAIMRARGMTTIIAIQTLLPVLCDPVIGTLPASHIFSF